MNVSQIHFESDLTAARKRFCTGVPLHGHTLHSQEKLDFILSTGKASSRRCRIARKQAKTPISPYSRRDALNLRVPGGHRRFPPTTPGNSRSSILPIASASRLWSRFPDHDNIDGPILLQRPRGMPSRRRSRWNGPFPCGADFLLHHRHSNMPVDGSPRHHGGIGGVSRRKTSPVPLADQAARARGESGNPHHFQPPELG